MYEILLVTALNKLTCQQFRNPSVTVVLQAFTERQTVKFFLLALASLAVCSTRAGYKDILHITGWNSYPLWYKCSVLIKTPPHSCGDGILLTSMFFRHILPRTQPAWYADAFQMKLKSIRCWWNSTKIIACN